MRDRTDGHEVGAQGGDAAHALDGHVAGQLDFRASVDERNFVKKGVNWALRRIGWRNARLNAATVKLARRLAESKSATPRWIGKDALRELTSEKLQKRLKA